MKLEVATIAPIFKVGALLLLLLCSITTFASAFIPSDLAVKKAQITIEKMFGRPVVWLDPYI